MTSVRLPEDIAYRLNALSLETHRTKSFYIVEALKRYLEDLEDIYATIKRDADTNDEFYTRDEILEKLRLHAHI